MKINRKIRHEEKNGNGRTLFVIDVYLYEDIYQWHEGTFIWLPEECADQDELKENEFAFLFSKLVINLPIELYLGCKEISDMKQKFDNLLMKDPNADISELISELCSLIIAIPNIELIFLPDFALDEIGNYDESFMISALEKQNDHKLQIFPCPIGTYTNYLFDEADKYFSVLSQQSSPWLYNCIRFLFGFVPDEFPSEKLGIDEIIPAIEDGVKDYVLDLSLEPGYFVRFRFDGKDKEESVFSYVLNDEGPICYIMGN